MTLLQSPGTLAGTFAVAAGVLNIGDGAFSGCSGLTNFDTAGVRNQFGDLPVAGMHQPGRDIRKFAKSILRQHQWFAL